MQPLLVILSGTDLNGYRLHMKRHAHFWEVDLIELSRDWFSQFLTLLMTAVAFVGMALPVLIPAFIMWYLAGFPRLF